MMKYRTVAIEVDSYSGTSYVRVGFFKAKDDREAKVKAYLKIFPDRKEEVEEEDIEILLEEQDCSDTRIEEIINLESGNPVFDLGTGFIASFEDWN